MRALSEPRGGKPLSRTTSLSTTQALADIPVGRKVVIESLPDHTPFGRRLMEVGLVPGLEAVVMGRAPMQDPIQICVLGALMAIRVSDAMTIRVTLLPHGH